ncbi:B-cell receptor CD22-like [Astyanax mexicanus]|uniref:B-cell receptor CD22-like n=1 Tax=Astyanax mexicanus TaxID=7994 RepID=UPI0020CB5665|nr:B-cell receptor CD22-like [Astyanax mexicanus]
MLKKLQVKITRQIRRSCERSLSNQIFTASYVSGASGAEWSMNYIQQGICALNGSTVFMNGTFTHPERLTVKKSFWVIDPVKDVDPPDLSAGSSFSGRVEYLVDEKKNFALKLRNVMKKDEHEYYFRVLTDVEGQKWMRSPGIKLRVTELHVESPGEVTEGESAVLTCKTTCSLTDPTFIWYKDGRPLTTEMIQKNQQLHLQTVSSEDAGSYSCAVRGSEHLPSTAQTLRVRHPPKNVSVSISPSGGIVEGSSVTLNCSSDGYPPVEIYTWFKGSSSVGTGGTYSIPNISSEDSGEYTCQSRNELGERRSTAVSLNVLYPPKNVSVSISPSGGIVEGSSVTLTCSSDGDPPVEIYTWFKGSSSVGIGGTYSIPNISSEDSGEYTCQSRNELGERRSTAVSLNVLYPPKSVSVSISPSGGIVEGSSVTLTCSSDGDPPVENYTWFKDGGDSPVGSGQSFSIINITADHTGLYYCEAQNAVGVQNGSSLVLETLYPPKNISVSISPSGGIVEGSSVNLTCSSDGYPPVENYTWFKGSSSVGTGGTYSIPNISSEDSGEYTCQSRNELGERRSTAVSLNVLYPPKSVSVSISPSGGIVEGSSVTLTCSSDGDPPVENYTWFKGSSSVGTGGTYSLPNISSEDSGEYTCQSRNELGERRSTAVSLNVLYPPKSVSVSISPSGGIVEGSSVTLTCSSDGNPPVENYTWFKDGGDSPVGSGQSFSDDVQYATVTHSRSRPVETAGDASSGAPDHDDDVQYATVRTGRKPDVVIRSDQQEELQYASVTFHHRHADAAATG